jgi:hypothetical protein
MKATDSLKKAIESIKKPEVHEIPKEKIPKCHAESKGSYWPPCLYLTTKDFPGIKDWKAGQKVHLAITCDVTNVNINTNETAGKKEEHHSVDLKIAAISDITKWQEARSKK